MTRPVKKPGYSPMQAAIYAAMTAAGLVVFDKPGENQPFPYQTIGESSVIEEGTKTENADEHFETIHIWSRYSGFKECKDLASKTVEALSGYNYSSVIGYKVRFLGVDSANFLTDPDGLTRHGVVRVKFKMIQE